MYFTIEKSGQGLLYVFYNREVWSGTIVHVCILQ